MSEKFEYEVYHGSKDTPLGRYSLWNAPKDTIIIVNTGGVGGVKYLDKEFWCSDGSFWLDKNDEIIPKYLYYVLSKNEKYFATKKRIAGVPTIDKKIIENFEIKIPSIEIQKRIVYVLDNFEKICLDLNIGLPSEIDLRQKQYEYYRDLLLTFSNDLTGGA